MYNFLLIIYILFLYIMSNLNLKNKNNNKGKNVFLVLSFISFFFFVSLRSIYTGSDTIGYVNSFKLSILYKWDYLDISRFEKGFLAFQILLGNITHNYRIYLIVLSAIFNYGIYKFIKKYSTDYFLSVMLYVCLLFYYSSMTMIRQFFAIVIILYLFKYVKNKKIFYYMIGVIIATQFHITSLVCLLIYPMYHIKFNKKRAIILFITAVLMLLFLLPLATKLFTIVGWKYSYDIRTEDFSLANFLYAIVYLIIFLFAKIILSKKEFSKDNSFYLYVFLLAFLINFIGIKMNIFARMADYFTIFTVVALPNVISQIKKIECKREILVVMILFLMMYSSTITILRPEWNTAFNYKFWFYEPINNIIDVDFNI